MHEPASLPVPVPSAVSDANIDEMVFREVAHLQLLLHARTEVLGPAVPQQDYQEVFAFPAPWKHAGGRRMMRGSGLLCGEKIKLKGKTQSETEPNTSDLFGSAFLETLMPAAITFLICGPCSSSPRDSGVATTEGDKPQVFSPLVVQSYPTLKPSLLDHCWLHSILLETLLCRSRLTDFCDVFGFMTISMVWVTHPTTLLCFQKSQRARFPLAMLLVATLSEFFRCSASTKLLQRCRPPLWLLRCSSLFVLWMCLSSCRGGFPPLPCRKLLGSGPKC